MHPAELLPPRLRQRLLLWQLEAEAGLDNLLLPMQRLELLAERRLRLPFLQAFLHLLAVLAERPLESRLLRGSQAALAAVVLAVVAVLIVPQSQAWLVHKEDSLAELVVAALLRTTALPLELAVLAVLAWLIL